MVEISQNELATISIGAIVILEAIALLMGYNGTLLAAVIAIIAGLGGYAVGNHLRE